MGLPNIANKGVNDTVKEAPRDRLPANGNQRRHELNPQLDPNATIDAQPNLARGNTSPQSSTSLPALKKFKEDKYAKRNREIGAEIASRGDSLDLDFPDGSSLQIGLNHQKQKAFSVLRKFISSFPETSGFAKLAKKMIDPSQIVSWIKDSSLEKYKGKRVIFLELDRLKEQLKNKTLGGKPVLKFTLLEMMQYLEANRASPRIYNWLLTLVKNTLNLPCGEYAEQEMSKAPEDRDNFYIKIYPLNESLDKMVTNVANNPAKFNKTFRQAVILIMKMLDNYSRLLKQS